MSLCSALLVGHCCHDTLILSDGSRSETLGGSVSYISRAFSELGTDYEVASKVGRDFAYLSNFRQKPQVISHAKTTHFIADFRQGERIAKVDTICEAIFPSDIPTRREFELGLAVGIAGEILPETLEALFLVQDTFFVMSKGLCGGLVSTDEWALDLFRIVPFLEF